MSPFCPSRSARATFPKGEPPCGTIPRSSRTWSRWRPVSSCATSIPVHVALFAARHDEGLDIRDPAVIASILDAHGVPGDKVMAEVESGAPIDEIRKAHVQAVNEWSIFGVPTFVVEGRAVFVRQMDRPEGDAALARRTIEGIVGLMDAQPELNEFKYTTLER